MELPSLFVDRMRVQLDTEYAEFAESLATPGPTSIRHHPLKSNATTEPTQQIPWCSSGAYLTERPVFTLDPLYHAGCYYVQEASSMILEAFFRMLPPSDSPRTVLDLCAAPGGKATHLLSLMGTEDILVANEIHPNRHGILFENLTRWGNPQVLIARCSPDQLSSAHAERFDIILVDAPCSGEGMFRKDPVAVRQWNMDLVNQCVKRQENILQDVMQLLRPGGYLIYSTCTFNREENEDHMDRLVQEKEYAEIRPDMDPTWGVRASDRGFRCYPHLLRGEGLYMCMLRKPVNDIKSFTRAGRQSGNRHLGNLSPAPEAVRAYVKGDNISWFLGRQDQWRAIPANVVQTALDLIHSPLDIQSGVIVGKMKTPTVFIPDHALALSSMRNGEVPQFALAKEDALRFLKKETIPISDPTTGIRLITYQGFGLGWAKVVPGRLNNLIPHHWRIRMSIPD